MVLCEVCQKNQHKYKCPQCLIKYCSLPCFKNHKDGCQKKDASSSKNGQNEDNESLGTNGQNIEIHDEDESEDRVAPEMLEKLGESEELKALLENPHLRQLMKHVDSTEDVEKAIEAAMQEPIFVEFADVCLRTVEPDKG